MINLLDETIRELERNGKTPRNIWWIGSYDGKFAIRWPTFCSIAKDVEYSNISNMQHIAKDLVVVGNGWWLERTRTGSPISAREHWQYRTTPHMETMHEPFFYLYTADTMCDSKTLEEINKKGTSKSKRGQHHEF